jgi:hypothetical protein
MKASLIVVWVALSACTLAAESIEPLPIKPLPIAEKILINGIEISTAKPPRGTAVREKLGLLTVDALDGQVVHRTSTRILETRATITPGGDYLLMFPEGEHYANAKGRAKVNSLIAYRSKDRGRTWQGPTVAYDIPYSQHGFIPLVPRGTKRHNAFGTQPIVGYPWENGQHENAPIGFRYSDDDGYTWSDVQLIAPTNDPEFRGMSVMRMTETDSGAWLVGSHIADWSVKPIKTKQYLLQSEDQGKSWTVLPAARPGGWFAEGFDRMDEGRPLNLGGGRVLFMSRTPEGHLFTAFSTDDGKTFSKPAPSTLVHPDAPPMVFPLSDGKTLVALHHNRTTKSQYGAFDNHSEGMKVRSEIWASTSTDGGHTWSEPRWLLANVAAHTLKSDAWNYQCSYIDAFTDGGKLHLFMPHRWQQALYMTIDEKALTTLPTKAELQQAAAAVPKLMSSYRVEGRMMDPLAPPQGFKTYRDVGLIVDETMLVRTPSAKVSAKATKFVERKGPLFDKPNQWKVTKDANSNTLWCSYSKDDGKSWSVPRFVAALVTEDDAIVDVELGKASGKSLTVMLTSLKGRYDIRFREDDLCRLATSDDIQQAPPGGLVCDTVAEDKLGTNMIADRPNVSGYRVDRELGLFLHDCIGGQVLHTAESDVGTLYESRGVVTPGGDYLVFIPDGRHANSPRDDANRFVAYRSKDQGHTWTKLGDPFGTGEKHHAALPLVSRDGRLYVLESLRGLAVSGVKSGRAFGYRFSDDDGHHWSQPHSFTSTTAKPSAGRASSNPPSQPPAHGCQVFITRRSCVASSAATTASGRSCCPTRRRTSTTWTNCV